MTTTINGRTPEEIKKGLECCGARKVCFTLDGSDVCSYDGTKFCIQNMAFDTLAYIQQLERERDAAVAQLKAVDINSYFECSHCKHEELCDSPVWPCNDCENEGCTCHTCADGSNWQWRGVREE